MKIGITNLKGGVGKSTITQNLAVCLAHLYYKVVVDTDINQDRIIEKIGKAIDSHKKSL